MWAARVKELIGILMIGEGVVMMLEPRRHVLLWDGGPRAWERMIDFFAQRPGLTRAIGAAELVAGLLLALRQDARVDGSMRRLLARHRRSRIEAIGAGSR